MVGGTHRKLALAKAEELVRASRIGKSVKFTIPNIGLVHEIGDLIKLNSKAGFVTNEYFRITALRVSPNDLQVGIEADRFEYSTLAWNVDDTYVEPAIVIPSVVTPNVTNLTWNEGARREGLVGNGYLTWTAPSSTEVRRYQIWARAINESEFTKLGETSRRFFDLPADFNLVGADHYFLVKVETPTGRLSQGTIILADLMPNLVPVHGVTKEVGVNTVKLAWSNANPELVGGYKVWMSTSNVRSEAMLFGTTAQLEMVVSPLVIATYYFWIDAHGVDGSVAAMASPIAVSSIELGISGGDISANTITWDNLASDVIADLEATVSVHAANAAAFADAAEIHANAANTAKNEAAVSANNANNSASAAATSASQASISANNANTSAAASANSAVSANTSAGQALVYRNEAATSASSANTAATTAASQATIATNARNSANTYANAASSSASAASSSASSASSSASAANTSRTNAETARSQAETFKNQAATSATDAASSASAAGISEGTIAKLMGSENYDNSTFRNWNGSTPAGASFTSETNRTISTSTNSGKYHGYVELRADVTSGTTNRPYMDVRSTYVDGLTIADGVDTGNVAAIRVTAEVEKISGSWGGACIRVQWNGSNVKSVDYFVGDNVSSENGLVQTIEFEAIQPEGFVADSGAYLRILIFGTSTYSSHTNEVVRWRLHRLSIKQLTEAASTVINQRAITSIEGNMAASIGMRVAAGSAGAELELVALDEAATGTAVSAARISADQILLDGSVRARQLTIDENLVINDQNGSFSLGKSAVTSTSDGIFLGRNTAQNGSLGFGFAVGRTSGGTEQAIVISKDEGLKIKNATFLLGSGTSVEAEYATSQTVSLPSGTTTITSLVIGGGGGGGQGGGQGFQTYGGTGSAGGATTVILKDGTTTVATYTATGGAGGAGGNGSSYTGKLAVLSAFSPYSNGGAGGRAFREGSEGGYGGDSGDAGQIRSWSDIDVSGLSDPKLVITIGAGGNGGSGYEPGLAGAAGKIELAYSGDIIVGAGPIAYTPAFVGAWSYGGGNSYSNLPAKGGNNSGAYYLLSNVPAGAQIDLQQGAILTVTHAGQFGFFTESRPKFKHGNSVTLNYYIYPLG